MLQAKGACWVIVAGPVIPNEIVAAAFVRCRFKDKMSQ
jgi:hypothetical protein